MNDKEVKQLTIAQAWNSAEPKSGDAYRSISLQIDNFINHIKKQDSPLSWMPIEIMSDLEISQVAVAYLKRSEENRLLLDNIEHKGLKYDYSDLIATDLEKERDKESILEITPVLGTFVKLKIKEEIPPMKKALRNCCRGDFLLTRDCYADWSTTILANILDEKNQIFCMGIGFTYVDYIEQYISFVESMVIESLMAFIIRNDFVHDKITALSIIEKKLPALTKMMDERVEKSRSDLIQRRDHFRLDNVYADMISLYYVQFLSRRAKYDEMEVIYQTLLEEIASNPALFEAPTVPPKSDLADYKSIELKRLITEGAPVPQFTQKLYETQQLIEIMRATGNEYYGSQNVLDLKPVFRELFMSNSSYRDNRAMSIARGIIRLSPNIRLDAAQAMFLDAKISRGYFRQWNMMQEYAQFTRIISTFRRELLKAYAALDDRCAYYIIRDAGQFAMYAFFCDPPIE